MLFWDPPSQTFVNVFDNDMSVLISIQKRTSVFRQHRVILKLFNTNKYAPGPHQFKYGGFTGRQFVTNAQKDNILCYKFLNNYQLKSEGWVKAQAYRLRHHKNCNFDFFYINYDPKKLKTKHKWREDEDSEEHDVADDHREEQSEEEGDDDEREGTEKEKKDPKKGLRKNDKCSCTGCCDDYTKKELEKTQRNKRGEPDDDDDITPVPHTKPKKPVPIGGGGGGGGGHVHPPPPKPEPKPEEPKPPGKGELNVEFGMYVEREFYIISSLGENRYLDVIDQRKVVIKTPNEYDSQKWWFDQTTKTIKNKMYTDKSLDIANGGQGDDLQLWHTNGHWFQVFKFQSNYFVNVKDDRVFTVEGAKDSEGQNVVVSKKNWAINQKWQIRYVDQAEDSKNSGLYTPYQIYLGRPFIIRSRLPMQRVLTVVGGRNLVIKTHDRTEQNQVFFLDPGTKTIKSVGNKMKSIDIQNSGNSANLQVWKTNARWFQLFKYDNGAIINIKDGRAMDVSGNQDRENQNVIVFKRHNALNQQWDIVYIDTLQQELQKGDWWPAFGMYISKEFSIITKMSSQRYLDVIGDQIVLKTRTASTTQKWYLDYESRTIINVQTKKSFSIESNGSGRKMKVWSTKSEWFQIFRYTNEMFINVKGKALEVIGGKDQEGAELGVGTKVRALHQRFIIVYTDKETELKKDGVHTDFGFHIGRPFYIITKMGSGRAIEVTGGRNLVLKWKRFNHVSQQFFFDNATKTIKSQQYKDRSLDIQNAGKSSNLQIWSTNGRWFQMFKLRGENIVNEKGKALDVSGALDKENQNIIVWTLHNKMNQKWRILYVDEDQEEPGKGELNTDFNLYVERPFYVETHLSSHRYLDILGNNLVIKTPNGYATQRWYFDQRTKTIKSVAKANTSWDIQSAGRSTNLQVWSTNSGWWQFFKFESNNFVNLQSGKVLDVSGGKDAEG